MSEMSARVCLLQPQTLGAQLEGGLNAHGTISFIGLEVVAVYVQHSI